MQKVKPEDGQSADIVAENIERLKELFPEAFTEGGVDFDVLRQLLGDAKVLDEGEEKYGLNWHGKKKARQIALTPSTGTLLPCPEESVDWDTTQNLFIEGDNLEALKLLRKSYANRIKVIYIDPPYNTGNEFIYPDRFQENLNTYLQYTGQVDESGIKFSSNTETTGRKHTNWLNMMYPRLKIARDLLAHDGIIAISIDDNEVFDLGKLMDDMFGHENRLACAPWLSEASGGKEKTGLRTGHEYILIYVKNDPSSISTDERSTGDLNLKDNQGAYRKGRELMKWGGTSLRSDRPNQFYQLPAPDGTMVYPYRNDGEEGHWRWGQNNPEILVALKDFSRFHWEKRPFDEGVTVNGCKDRWVPYEKIRDIKKSVGWSTWLDKYGSNADATRELKNLLGKKIFDTPKPTSLIKWIINLHADDDGIVLDFFSGSSSTAHAVISLNMEDSGKRRFINIQLPEKIDSDSDAGRSGLKTVADIGKYRIRRLIENIKEQSDTVDIDLGFKVFKLSSSNLNLWNPNKSDLPNTLIDHEDHILEGRSEQDILYELLLKRGVELTTPVDCRRIFEKNIYCIGYGVMFACLDEEITYDQVEEIANTIISWYAELAPYNDPHVFFRDSAFIDDVAKTNMAAILEQSGISHVRSL